jgi:putative hydrolase of the HAD superfamily
VKVRCVFFDAAGTIIHAEPTVETMYARALNSRGLKVEAERVGDRFASAWQEMREEARSRPPYGTDARGAREWWEEVVRRTYEPWLEHVDAEEIFEELWQHFAGPRAWRVYGDVIPCFNELEGMGVRLGLISNWDVRLPRVLRGLGLWDRFEVTVVSYDVGAEKPDSRIFREALRRAELEPEQGLHVGDSYEADLRGAQRVGMYALWLNRDAGPAPEEEEGIPTLMDIPTRVRGDEEC